MAITEYVKKANGTEAVKSTEASKLNALPTDDGMTFFFDSTNSAGVDVQLDRMCTRLNIATDDAGVAQAKTTTEDFSTVFSQWQRVAIDVNGNPRAKDSELDNWSYVAATDSIVGSLNTTTLVGFVSQRVIPGDYSFEVAVSSTDVDDDFIGLFLGYVEINGVAHHLTVMRNAGSSANMPLFGLYLDFSWTGGQQVQLDGGNYDLVYPDGQQHTDFVQGSTLGGWNAYKALGLIKIKATLVGSVITVQTSNPGEDYSPSAKITFDLNSRADTAQFMTGTKIGYAAMSQARCTWKSLLRPGAFADYVDARTGTGYSYNGTSWVAIPADEASGYVRPGRHYFSPMNNTLFFYNPQRKQMDVVATISYAFATTQQAIDGVSDNLLISPKTLRAVYDATRPTT